MKKTILSFNIILILVFIIGCTEKIEKVAEEKQLLSKDNAGAEEKPSLSNWSSNDNLNLPPPLAQYLTARQCGNAQCEFQEDSTSCPADCSKAELSADQWTQVNGPYGGLITDLEKVGTTLWAATSFTYELGGNGIFEVTNKGLAWKALGGTNKRVLDVAVDSSDIKNIAFIADAPFISWDGGNSWQRIELEADTYTSVAMSPANPSLIFVGAVLDGKGLVFVSLDDGKNWMKTSFLSESEWDVKPIWAGFPDEAKNFIKVIEPHPTNENILFVGTNSALFKSEDKGYNWERVDATFHRTDILGIKINPQNPDEVYVRVGVFEDFTCFEAAGRENPEAVAKLEKEKCAGVYKSNDLGKTWQQLDAYYFDPSEGGVFIDDNNPNIVYAIFSRKILKTEDGGKTWEKFFFTHDEPFIQNSGIERLTAGENSDEVFIAGRQGLFHTEDAGENWHERNKGFIGSEIVDIIKASDGTLYAGTYSLGMFKSTDQGQSWTFSSYNLENPYIMLIAAHPTESKTVFVTTNGGVYVSLDAGLTWERAAKDFFKDSELLPGIAHFHGLAFDPEDPNRIYVGGGGDQYSPNGVGISISEDGGKNWKQANIGFETDVHVSKIIVDKSNPSIIYATTQGPTNFNEKTGSGYGVFKSTDYGKSWKKINSGLETVETNTIALDPNDSNILYLGTDDDGVYKSSDGGTSWKKLYISQLPKNYGVGDIVVDPRNSNLVYAATVDYFRLFTARGLVGDHGVYKSSDGGTSWQPFNEGLNHKGAFALEIDPEKGILYVGTRGGGIYWRKV